jgi:Ribbon-helix-helix protein, copG family
MFDKYEGVVFTDGRGQYPERLKIATTRGTRARIKRAAEREGLSTSEIIRRAVAAYLERFGGPGGSHEARA